MWPHSVNVKCHRYLQGWRMSNLWGQERSCSLFLLQKSPHKQRRCYCAIHLLLPQWNICCVTLVEDLQSVLKSLSPVCQWLRWSRKEITPTFGVEIEDDVSKLLCSSERGPSVLQYISTVLGTILSSTNQNWPGPIGDSDAVDDVDMQRSADHCPALVELHQRTEGLNRDHIYSNLQYGNGITITNTREENF